MSRKLGFFAVLVGLLALIALAIRGIGSIGAPVTLSQLSQVSQTVKLKFPPDAVLLDGERGGGLSPYVLAKIRMPRARLHPFLAQPPLDGKFENYGLDERSVSLMTRRGWKPNAARHLVSLDGVSLMALTNASDGLWLTADLDDPAFAVVYLYYQN